MINEILQWCGIRKRDDRVFELVSIERDEPTRNYWMCTIVYTIDGVRRETRANVWGIPGDFDRVERRYLNIWFAEEFASG